MRQDNLLAALQQHFGFAGFRAGQREAIEHVLAGRSALVVMPTGAGKSLCFQLAALCLPGTTLVVSPLIALMKDQVDRLAARGVAATLINSSIPAGEQRARLQGLASGDYKLVYVAPERLRSSAFQQALDAARVSLLAVDEAHCISHWGHDFRPDYLHIGPAHARLARNGGAPPVLALTATATPQVQQDILQRLDAQQAPRIVTGFNRPNLTFEVRYASDDRAKLRALQDIVEQASGAGIVYTGTRLHAEEAAEFVSQFAGFRVPHYHAGLDAATRSRIQEAFMSGRTQIVAATNAFGMGIDRADLRFVLHYSLPGTLEAYYQEAGRAGRDGLPARCVLLYSPQDRALQEWFIRSEAPALEDLRLVHDLISRPGAGPAWYGLADMARETGLRETKIKLALSLLETAGAVLRHGDEGVRTRLEARPLPKSGLREIEAAVVEHQRHRLKQLQHMVRYAESDRCRRRTLLDHFGDPSAAEAEACCDVCLAREQEALAAQAPKAQSDAEWAALIILESVALLNSNIGRSTLNKILRASRSKLMKQRGYQRHKHFGRLAVYKEGEVNGLIDQLIASGYLKTVGGEYPVLSLTPAARTALARRAAVPLALPREVSRAEREHVKAQREAGGTLQLSLRLLQNGLTPAQIAAKRGLTENTVLGHAAALIEAGQVAVDTVVPPGLLAEIEAALDRAGGVGAAKALLPESISYGQIRCVAAARARASGGAAPTRRPAQPAPDPDPGLLARLRQWRKGLAQERKVASFTILHDRVLQAIAARLPQTLADLQEIPGIGPVKSGQYGQAILEIVKAYRVRPRPAATPGNLPAGAPHPAVPLDAPEEDDIEVFLKAPRPKALPGPWKAGLALDFHSRFQGSRWARTEVGELAYRFKYAGEEALARPLARRLAEALRANPAFARLDVLLPVPSTNEARPFDPVPALARALAAELGIPARAGQLVKTRPTQPQKEMKNLPQKQSNVRGAFALSAGQEGQRVLVVDDLYDSGETLHEIARVLRAAGAEVFVAVLTKTIHAD